MIKIPLTEILMAKVLDQILTKTALAIVDKVYVVVQPIKTHIHFHLSDWTMSRPSRINQIEGFVKDTCWLQIYDNTYGCVDYAVRDKVKNIANDKISKINLLCCPQILEFIKWKT